MELFKEIIKAFCFISVILSITELLIREETFKRSVRFVVGLIFIAAVIKPFLSDGLELNLDGITSPELSKLESMSEEMSSAVANDYISALSDEITNALSDKGINVLSVDIKTQTNEYNETEISEIRVYTEGETDADEVIEALEDILDIEDEKINVIKK